MFFSFFQPHVGKVTRFASCISVFFGQASSSSFHSFGFVSGCKRGIHLLMAILAGSHMAKPMELCIFSHQKVTRSSRRLERAFAYDEYEEEVQFSAWERSGSSCLAEINFSWSISETLGYSIVYPRTLRYFQTWQLKITHWVRWPLPAINLQL